MNIVEAERRLWLPEYKKQHAPVKAGVDEPTVLIDAETGAIIAAQIVLEDAASDERKELARWLRYRLTWDDTSKASTAAAAGGGRLSGIRYASRVFGYTAPSPLRRRWGASVSQLNVDYPEVAEMLDAMTRTEWDLFEQNAPDAAVRHAELVGQTVHNDWLMAGIPWTSGIINNTAALPYHRDAGNIKGSWSAMLALRNGVGGGCLDLPEYGLTLGIPDGSVTLFDGQGTWHGVTPLVNEKSNAYRFTLVWYAKSGFKSVGSAEDNIKLAQQRATRS